MRKPDSNSVQKKEVRSVKWASYERGKTRKKKLGESKVKDDSNAIRVAEGQFQIFL